MVCSLPTASQSCALRTFANLVSEVAVSEAGVGQPDKCADTLGTPHQGDRVSLWIRCCFILHLLALAVLGEPGDHGTACSLRRCSWGTQTLMTTLLALAIFLLHLTPSYFSSLSISSSFLSFSFLFFVSSLFFVLLPIVFILLLCHRHRHVLDHGQRLNYGPPHTTSCQFDASLSVGEIL